jgi:hypothetical protein
MVHLTSLWLPILLSAVACFVASSIIHMFLGYHQSDYGKVPQEDAVMDALRAANLAPRDYLVPHPGSREHMRSEEYKNKVNRGPVATITVMTGFFAMGKRFAQWFVYLLVVGVFSACVAVPLLSPGAPHKVVFHTVGLVAFAAYGLALWQGSIWYGRSWSTALKSNIDALIYAAITGGIFAWLWPR